MNCKPSRSRLLADLPQHCTARGNQLANVLALCLCPFRVPPVLQPRPPGYAQSLPPFSVPLIAPREADSARCPLLGTGKASRAGSWRRSVAQAKSLPRHPLVIKSTSKLRKSATIHEMKAAARKNLDAIAQALKGQYGIDKVHLMAFTYNFRGRVAPGAANQTMNMMVGFSADVCIGGTIHQIEGHEDTESGTSHVDNDRDTGRSCTSRNDGGGLPGGGGTGGSRGTDGDTAGFWWFLFTGDPSQLRK